MKRTLIATALALAASTALAQGYGYGPGMGYGRGMGYGPGWGGASLTSEQREKIAAIQDEVRAQHWNTREQLRTEMLKLNQMNAESPGYAEQLKKVTELREQMFKSRADARRRIDEALK